MSFTGALSWQFWDSSLLTINAMPCDKAVTGISNHQPKASLSHWFNY